MKKLLDIILLTLLFFSGCATTVSTNRPLSSEEAYIGGNFDLFTHTLELMNIDSGKKVKVTFALEEHPTIATIPPGRWTVRKVYGSKGNRNYSVDVPIPLLTILDVAPGELIYIGDWAYSDFERNFLNSSGSLGFEYLFERFVQQTSNSYNIPNSIQFIPITLMPELNVRE